MELQNVQGITDNVMGLIAGVEGVVTDEGPSIQEIMAQDDQETERDLKFDAIMNDDGAS